MQSPGKEDILLEPLPRNPALMQERLSYWCSEIVKVRNRLLLGGDHGCFIGRVRLADHPVSGHRRYSYGIYVGPYEDKTREMAS